MTPTSSKSDAVPAVNIGLTKSSVFPFLKLSAELRNRVYGFAVIEEDDIDIETTKCRPGILRATMETKSEATSIYFGRNNFYASISSGHDVLLGWLRMLGEDEAKHLRKLTIECIKDWLSPRVDIIGAIPLCVLRGVVLELSKTRLVRSQLSWSVLQERCPKRSSFELPVLDVADLIYHVVKCGEMIAFNRWYLAPFLQAFDLYDEQRLDVSEDRMVEWLAARFRKEHDKDWLHRNISFQTQVWHVHAQATLLAGTTKASHARRWVELQLSRLKSRVLTRNDVTGADGGASAIDCLNEIENLCTTTPPWLW
jgi:hypothetical protein